MKYIISLVLVVTSLFSQEYYAKVEPIHTYNIKSSVSGKVIFANTNLEASIVKDTVVIKIDDKINKIELAQNRVKFTRMNKVLKIHKETLKSFNKVSSKSKFDKDKQKIVILNSQVSLNDLRVRIETLKDTISNKNIKLNNLYIQEIFVNNNDYINPGTLLIKALDLSEAKLEIFVSSSEIEDINKKEIYIDDKKSNLKISKIYKTTDSKHLSSYKVEIILSNVGQFSKLVKVSFK